MTPREFFNARDGYNVVVEREIHMSWEQTRWLATVIVNINAPKGKRYKPSDLVKFPWEDGGDTLGVDEGIQKIKERRKKHG